MSSEIYNHNYGRSIYNLRLNSLTFSATKNKIWQKDEQDSFLRSSVEGVPIETKAKIFSNELARLVKEKKATPSRIHQALSKYIQNTKVELISMNDYDEFGINTKRNVAAATRPKYDENGNLQGIKIFIPEIVYGDKLSENKYIENLTHEVTHAMQYAELKDISKNLKNTQEGRFYNFYQQNAANMLIDTVVQKTLVYLARRDQIVMNSLEDYDRFLETPCPSLEEEEIEKIFTKNRDVDFAASIKTGFDVFMSDLLEKMQYEDDPEAKKIIAQAGGLDKFKTEVMRMTAQTLRNEEEAYRAGSLARKNARGYSGLDYNDAISKIIGMTADALVV